MEDLNQAADTTASTAGTTEGAAAAGSAPAEKVKVPGVGDKAKELIRAGLGNKEVLEGIKAAFPDAKTTMSSVNWYRNNLRSEGEDVKTARELSAAGKPSDEEVKAEKEKAKADKKAKADAERAEKKAKKDAEKAEKKAAEKAAKEAAATAPTEPAAGEPAAPATGEPDFMG